MPFSIYISLSAFCLLRGKWRNICCRICSYRSGAINLADAAETPITQTVTFPTGFEQSISILGVATDGVTTFLAFEPIPDSGTTDVGMNLVYQSFQG
jgi:hypothetical protein